MERLAREPDGEAAGANSANPSLLSCIPDNAVERVAAQRAELKAMGIPLCHVQVEGRGGHRLMDFSRVLSNLLALNEDLGLLPAEPHVILATSQPGQFTPPASNTMPLSTFIDLGRLQFCTPHNLSVPRIVLQPHNLSCTSRERLAKPRWCRSIMSVVDHTADFFLCVSICSALPCTRTVCSENTTGLMGQNSSVRHYWPRQRRCNGNDTVKEAAAPSYVQPSIAVMRAIRFLRAQPRFRGQPFALVVPLGRGHSKSILGVDYEGYRRRRSTANQSMLMPSPPLMALAERITRGYLACGSSGSSRSKRQVTLAGMVRIAYGGGRGSPQSFGDACGSVLSNLARFVMQRSGGRCPHDPRAYLATDSLASADGWSTSKHQQAFEKCWAGEINLTKAPILWYWPEGPRVFQMLASVDATLAGRLGKTAYLSGWLRAFVDLAVLATVSDCFAVGHMGSLANGIRASLDKAACASSVD